MAEILVRYLCACNGAPGCPSCVDTTAYGWAEAVIEPGAVPRLKLVVRKSLPPGRSQLLHRLFSPEPMLQGEIEAMQTGAPVTGQGQVEGPPIKPRG